MHLKQLRSRIKRLERRSKGGECEACIRTALAEVTREKESTSTNNLICPDCGNPNPKIPLWVMDEIVANEEQMALAEERVKERFVREHPEGAPAPKVKAPGGEQ
jgi:hypothetical protein